MKRFLKNILLFISFLYSYKAVTEDKLLCISEIKKVEKHLNLPNNILLAISLTETGRLVDGMYIPWPWSLNVKGKGYYLDSKKQAINYALTNIKNFTKNVDIGCMQINYYYHGKKFKNFNDMINPKINVLYAGYFLLDLREKHGTWKEAIMRYHSSNPRRKKNYYNKVLNNWSYLGTDFKTTKVNKKYQTMLSSIEDTNLEYDNNDVNVTEKYAIEEMIISSGGYATSELVTEEENSFLFKEMPEYSKEFLFINEFTYMSKEDIINNLERIKEYKEKKK